MLASGITVTIFLVYNGLMDTGYQNLSKQTRIDYLMSRGPGGQRRDKKKTGVRLFHIPSGILVQVDDQRLQSQNKKIAFLILAKKLKKLRQRKKKRIPTRVPHWAKEKRLQKKKQRSFKKQLRSKWTTV